MSSNIFKIKNIHQSACDAFKIVQQMQFRTWRSPYWAWPLVAPLRPSSACGGVAGGGRLAGCAVAPSSSRWCCTAAPRCVKSDAPLSGEGPPHRHVQEQDRRAHRQPLRRSQEQGEGVRDEGSTLVVFQNVNVLCVVIERARTSETRLVFRFRSHHHFRSDVRRFFRLLFVYRWFCSKPTFEQSSTNTSLLNISIIILCWFQDILPDKTIIWYIIWIEFITTTLWHITYNFFNIFPYCAINHDPKVINKQQDWTNRW